VRYKEHMFQALFTYMDNIKLRINYLLMIANIQNMAMYMRTC